MAKGRQSKALQEFLSEAQEIVEALSRSLLTLDDGSQRGVVDPDLLNEAFRAAHSLKGLAGMFGVSRLAEVSHRLEDLLDGLRMGRLEISPTLMDLLFEGVEVLNLLIAEAGHEEAGVAAHGGAERARALMEAVDAALAASTTREDGDPLAGLDLDPKILEVLTEYEEHRLRENVKRGAHLVFVAASFDLMTFDRELAELTAAVKEHGEVISTLPSPDPGDGSSIAFDLLVGTDGPVAAIEEATRRFDVTLREVTRPAETAKSSAPERLATVQLGAGRAQTDEAVRAALEEADRLAEAMPPSLKSVAQTVRVDISRLDHLMNLVGELVLAKANLQRLAERLREHPQVAELAGELGREVRSLDRRLAELQEGVLDARMVPLKQTFDKLGRMVRKIGRETGKEIHLEVHGSDTELDKLIMEELSDPLMHLLRNAIDHGIEPAEERAAKGKHTAGRITIRAAQKGSHVTIEVADDGRGLDVEAITQRALERGLVSEAQLNEMSERDRLNLIFVPGFSTKDSVTELSGRGVGLDVVKNNISELSGLVEVATRPGAGTRFILTLPTTLAILQALVVQIAGRVFAVPLASVSEILSFDPTAVHRVEGHEVIDLRGRTLPLLHLDRLFGFDGAHAQPTYVVVAGLAESRIGLLVDTLQGEQDVVIKGLGKKLGHVRGIAGATDLGDRRTTLVLDVGALIEECLEGASLEAVGT